MHPPDVALAFCFPAFVRFLNKNRVFLYPCWSFFVFPYLFRYCFFCYIKIDHTVNSSSIVFKYNVIIQVSGDITNVETSAALTVDTNCWHNQSPQASISGANDIEDNPDLVNPTATLVNFNDWDVGNYELTAVSPLHRCGHRQHID